MDKQMNPKREEIAHQIETRGFALVREISSGEVRQVFGVNVDLSRFEPVPMDDKS